MAGFGFVDAQGVFMNTFRLITIISFLGSCAALETAQASRNDAAFKRFTETFKGTLHCRAADYPIEYTLIGDPATHEVIFSATRLSRQVVSDRRLVAKVSESGLSLELFTDPPFAVKLRISALQSDIEAWGDNVDQHSYFYSGNLVYSKADAGSLIFSAFHVACQLKLAR
jgi:hypothetical protein